MVKCSCVCVSSFLSYWWYIKIILMCKIVDMCHRSTWEKSGDVSHSQRKMGAGTGHVCLLLTTSGNLGLPQNTNWFIFCRECKVFSESVRQVSWWMKSIDVKSYCSWKWAEIQTTHHWDWTDEKRHIRKSVMESVWLTVSSRCHRHIKGSTTYSLWFPNDKDLQLSKVLYAVEQPAW